MRERPLPLAASYSFLSKMAKFPRCPAPLRAFCWSPRVAPQCCGRRWGGPGECARREDGAGKKKRSWAAPPTPPALWEAFLVEKEDSASLRWGVGVTSGRVTNWGGDRWACPCKAGGGAGRGRFHSKMLEGGAGSRRRGHLVGGAPEAVPLREGLGRGGGSGRVSTIARVPGGGRMTFPWRGAGPSRRRALSRGGEGQSPFPRRAGRRGRGRGHFAARVRGGAGGTFRGAVRLGEGQGEGEGAGPGGGSRKGGGAGGQWSLCVPAGVGRRRRRRCRHRGETLRRRCRWPRPRPRPPGAESRPGPKPPPLLRSSSPLLHSRLGGKWHLGGEGEGRTGAGGLGGRVRVRVF